MDRETERNRVYLYNERTDAFGRGCIILWTSIPGGTLDTGGLFVENSTTSLCNEYENSVNTGPKLLKNKESKN